MLGDLAPYLEGLLDGETDYGEPFIGGGSVAIYVARQFPKVRLHLNDKDPLIAGLWRVICGPKSAAVNDLIQRLDVKPTLEMWHSVRKQVPANDVERAFKAIFLNRTSWNGILGEVRPIGGLQQKSQWTVSCRYSVESLVTLVREYRQLLFGRTKVTCLDATEFMQTSFPCYLDPPYLMKGKNDLYGVTMTEDEHRRFAQALHSARKWVLTYDMKDTIACDLYFGVQKSLIDTRYSMDTAHRAHRRDVGISEWKKASEICAWKGFIPRLTN